MSNVLQAAIWDPVLLFRDVNFVRFLFLFMSLQQKMKIIWWQLLLRLTCTTAVHLLWENFCSFIKQMLIYKCTCICYRRTEHCIQQSRSPTDLLSPTVDYFCINGQFVFFRVKLIVFWKQTVTIWIKIKYKLYTGKKFHF